MKNGDISNRGGIVVAISCKGTLAVPSEKNILSKILKKEKYTLNTDAVNLVDYIFRYTDMQVVCVAKKTDVSCLGPIGDLPIDKIIYIKDNKDVHDLINSGRVSYYIDNHLDKFGLSIPKFSYSISDFRSIIRKR